MAWVWCKVKGHWVNVLVCEDRVDKGRCQTWTKGKKKGQCQPKRQAKTT